MMQAGTKRRRLAATSPNKSPSRSGVINNVVSPFRAPNHYWTSNSLNITCLSFRLDPGIDSEKKIICQKCLNYYDVVLKGDLARLLDKERSKGSKKHYCEKPWHPKFQTHRFSCRRQNYRDFRCVFDANVTRALLHDGGDSDNTTLSRTNLNLMDKDTFESTTHVAPIELVDSHNRITEETAVILIEALANRNLVKWPLLDHEISLAWCLLINDNGIRASTTDIISHCLKEKEDGVPLQPNESRLLGQLAYKTFKSTASKTASLQSFKRFKPFQIVVVPEAREARSSVARSVTRRQHRNTATAESFIDHLPGNFPEKFMISRRFH